MATTNGNGGTNGNDPVEVSFHRKEIWTIVGLAVGITSGLLAGSISLMLYVFMTQLEAERDHHAIELKAKEHVTADDARDTTTAGAVTAVSSQLGVQAEALDAIGDNVEMLMAVDKIKWKAKPMPTGLTMPMPDGTLPP